MYSFKKKKLYLFFKICILVYKILICWNYIKSWKLYRLIDFRRPLMIKNILLKELIAIFHSDVCVNGLLFSIEII